MNHSLVHKKQRFLGFKDSIFTKAYQKVLGLVLLSAVTMGLTLSSPIVSHAGGDIFITPTYRIMITKHCKKDAKVCKKVTFAVKHKKNGSILITKGKQTTAKTKTRHGTYNTKKQPVYFIFKTRDNGLHLITEKNQFIHIKNNKVTFQEKGKWLNKDS